MNFGKISNVGSLRNTEMTHNSSTSLTQMVSKDVQSSMFRLNEARIYVETNILHIGLQSLIKICNLILDGGLMEDCVHCSALVSTIHETSKLFSDRIKSRCKSLQKNVLDQTNVVFVAQKDHQYFKSYKKEENFNFMNDEEPNNCLRLFREIFSDKMIANFTDLLSSVNNDFPSYFMNYHPDDLNNRCIEQLHKMFCVALKNIQILDHWNTKLNNIEAQILKYASAYITTTNTQQQSASSNKSDLRNRFIKPHSSSNLSKQKRNYTSPSNVIKACSSRRENNARKLLLYRAKIGMIDKKMISWINANNPDNFCLRCNQHKVVDYNIDHFICHSCLETTPFIENDTKNLSFKDNLHFVKITAYEKINHFKKWLSHSQAKERTTIPNEILRELAIYLFNNPNKRKRDNSDVNQKTLRKCLHRMKLSKYYQNIPNIEYLLAGRKPMRLNQSEEKELIGMFYKIQEPFEKHKGSRSNFLYYGYLLRKFCEINGWYHYAEKFPLLQEDCLRKHDSIWEKICSDLKWEYKSTALINTYKNTLGQKRRTLKSFIYQE
jgi:hypothetical protein